MRLEPMRPAHASELFAWMRDPPLYRFLPQAPPHDVAALAATLRRWTGGAPSPSERWWNWIVREPAVADEPIAGHVQLTFTLSGDVLVAWVFAPRARGRGLATDATRRALDFVADEAAPHLGATVVAYVDALNAASISLAERLGLRRTARPVSTGGAPATPGTFSPGELRFERPLSAFAAAARGAAPEPVIRPATVADRTVLRDFLRAMWLDMGRAPALFHDDWERRFETRHDELARDASLRGFIAERAGRAIGCGSLHVYDSISPPVLRRRIGYVWGVYVRPDERGAGIARALVERCIAAARELNCSRVVLHASKEGRTVYERLGFRTSNEMVLELD